MYCIVNHENDSVAFINTTDIGLCDTSKCTIYYLPVDNVTRYVDGKFYTVYGEEYTGKVVDVTNTYIDLSSYSCEVTAGTDVTLTLPAAEYGVYYERTYAGKFTSDGSTPKTLKPKNIGQYKIIATDRPCNGLVIRVYEPAIEIF